MYDAVARLRAGTYFPSLLPPRLRHQDSFDPSPPFPEIRYALDTSSLPPVEKMSASPPLTDDERASAPYPYFRSKSLSTCLAGNYAPLASCGHCFPEVRRLASGPRCSTLSLLPVNDASIAPSLPAESSMCFRISPRTLQRARSKLCLQNFLKYPFIHSNAHRNATLLGREGAGLVDTIEHRQWARGRVRSLTHRAASVWVKP
jgi:hypothetical protein